MKKNTKLHESKKAKNDEFYTQIKDIEKELKHYISHFKDKVVFCNCDDPEWSEFFAYFYLNFEELGLKKLICSFYNPGTGINLSGGNPYISIIEPDESGKLEYIKINLNGDGDFRSEECIEQLKESDIVVTNPPFSLFREYVAQLMEYEKKFVIIGNLTTVLYKDVFPLIKDNKIFTGFNHPTNFIQPDGSIKTIGPIRWFTNIDIKKSCDGIELWRTYTPKEYPKYDNFDAINVNRVEDIPHDYYEAIGVPISFLDKFNPDQFEILGISNCGNVDDKYKLPHSKKYHSPYVGGKELFTRIFIRRIDRSLVTIYGNPVPKERPRHNAKTGTTYTPTKTKNAERDIGLAYINQDGTMHSGPVTVTIRFYLKSPKTLLYNEPVKKPDMDNLIKTVLDGLNGIAYEDDKQIIKISAEKHWAEDEPRTEILVYEYKNNI